MDDREFEKLMSVSAVRQVQLLNDSLPADAELNEIAPSEEFEQYMRMVIAKDQKRQKKLQGRKRFKKIVATFVLLAAVSFGAIMSVDATRAYFFQMFDSSFSITGQQNKGWNTEFNAQIIENIHNAYLPSWMPNGFKSISSSTSSSGNCVINYKNINDKSYFVRFSQNKSAGFLNDNELGDFSKLSINKQIYYYGEKNRAGVIERNLVWVSDERSFLISTTVSKDDLIKIATNLKFKD